MADKGLVSDNLYDLPYPFRIQVSPVQVKSSAHYTISPAPNLMVFVSKIFEI